jgi:hypothetical protein
LPYKKSNQIQIQTIQYRQWRLSRLSRKRTARGWKRQRQSITIAAAVYSFIPCQKTLLLEEVAWQTITVRGVLYHGVDILMTFIRYFLISNTYIYAYIHIHICITSIYIYRG